MNTKKAISKVRKAVESGKFTRYSLAKAAGIDRNALNSMLEPDWNPRASTLMALEAALEAKN